MSSFSHFFSKNFQHICISLDVNLNKSLTNEIVSFEQLGPEVYFIDNHQHSSHMLTLNIAPEPASVAQLDAPSNWRPGGRGFNPRRGRQHSFVELDHEIFSTVILSLPLIQEGQLSVSGERMCTILVNRLED